MNPQQNKNDLESLSSISIDPALRDFGNSTIFGGRKSSFDYVNILKDSEQLSKKDFRNSLDILASNINHGKLATAPIHNIFQLYNDQARVKIQQQGVQPLQIGEVYSESENQQSHHEQEQQNIGARNKIEDAPVKLQTVYSERANPYRSYFPVDLATVLKQRQIPLQYVRGLLMARNLKQVKSTRRLKVQRYLQKRRKKTWNRKICYNCRQKVAEQRLRIKGKFIKKRRAMEMLGIKRPIDTPTLRELLEEALKHSDGRQLDDLIKRQNGVKFQESEESINSPIQEQEDEEEEGSQNK